MASLIDFQNIKNFIEAPHKKEMQYFYKKKLEFVNKQHYLVMAHCRMQERIPNNLKKANATQRDNMCTCKWKTLFSGFIEISLIHNIV